MMMKATGTTGMKRKEDMVLSVVKSVDGRRMRVDASAETSAHTLAVCAHEDMRGGRARE